jgi:hypothetical protein
MNDSLMHRRGANSIRRWIKRNNKRLKHKAMDGHARIRLTPVMPMASKIMLALFLFIILVEVIACVAVAWAYLTQGI